MVGESDLLTTGEAAGVIGSSRQHVVNLCERGVLPFVRVGSHRRIRRGDLDLFLPGGDPQRRLHLRSLWLHRAVAGKLAVDPERVLALARENLARGRAIHPRSRMWLDQWARLLDDAEATLAVLTSPAERAIELRANSPFAGVLAAEERDRVLESFANWWRQRAAG